MRILTSGALSGIGKFIHERLQGFALTRTTSPRELREVRDRGVDVIVHCAFNSMKDVDSNSLHGYFEDNVLLTRELASMPHGKFVFFSTVDLYPRDGRIHVEDQVLPLENVTGIYALTKLISESIVREKCPDHLILRPTTMLGPSMRRNTLLRILSGETGPLYLSGDSRFNYVSYSDILDFIVFSIHRDVRGTFNIASSESIMLSDAAAVTGREVVFGSRVYDVGDVSNRKVASHFPAFDKTSETVLNEFIREWRNG